MRQLTIVIRIRSVRVGVASASGMEVGTGVQSPDVASDFVSSGPPGFSRKQIAF